MNTEKIEKLKRMANQNASPKEAQIAREKLTSMGITWKSIKNTLFSQRPKEWMIITKYGSDILLLQHICSIVVDRNHLKMQHNSNFSFTATEDEYATIYSEFRKYQESYKINIQKYSWELLKDIKC